MKILFATDYVCPYCIIGKASLKEAIKQSGIEVEIDTRPMQLTVEPSPKVDTWNNAQKREGYKTLDQAKEELKIDAKFPPYVVPRPYTRLAFEGHYYAMEHGLQDAYDDAMYRAYFVDERDIGEMDVLVDVARSVGLDPVAYKEALEKGTYTQIAKEADEYTKNVLDIHSVPTMMIEGEKIQFNDYTVEDALQILKKYV